MTRRELLSVVAAGIVTAPRIRAEVATRLLAGRVSAFSLSDVRLLEGPFLDAQTRDLEYLISLQPDRMLHNFRVNAGLDPKAPVYGGWESEYPLPRSHARPRPERGCDDVCVYWRRAHETARRPHRR